MGDNLFSAFNLPEMYKEPTYRVNLPEIPLYKSNPAKWTYQILVENIKDFENQLDSDHEIGARLVSFNNTVFYIQSLGYHEPEVLMFYGINDKGENIQLIQHVSQLNVLLVALKKIGNEAKRIGFKLDKEPEIPAE